MIKSMKIFLLIICGILIAGGAARADGDIFETTLALDEWGEAADAALPTVTAEGDFLLPTYEIPDDIADIPVVPPPAAQIKDEKKQTPPAPAPKATPKAPAPAVQPAPAKPAASAPKPMMTDKPTTPLLLGAGHASAPRAPAAEKKPVLVKLGNDPAPQPKEVKLPQKVRPIVPSDMADRVIAGIRSGRAVPLNMPSEIKITFYPKVAEFSGTTVKWIKAFGLKALQDPNTIILIRVSATDKPLQVKRARLIIQALKSVGLSTHQIQMACVDRPVDTIVLQVLPKPEQTRLVPVKSGQSSDKRKNVSTKEW